MEISMAARRANSFHVALVAQRHLLLYPHWQQSCCLLVTPTQQPLQGWVHEPLWSLTRWTLQKSVRQLLPQSSVELTVSHLHVLCPLGMSLVVVYQQSPTSLTDEPQGRRGWGPSPGLSLCSLGGRGGTGLRKSRCTAARPRRLSRLVCLRGSISTLIQIVVYAGAPLGPQKLKSIPPPPTLLL